METSNRRESRVRILAESCLLAVVLLPGLAIWTWVSGVVDLLTLGPGHVVMAPLTALLTGLCGFLALFGRGAIWEGNRRGIGMVRGLVLAVAISGLLIGIRPAFGWRSLIEEWLVGRYQSADGRPLGVTAPLLGWGVLLAAAVLWSRTVSRQGAGWRAAERLLSSLLCLGGVLFAAAYLGGFSVLPDADGREAPIALWSAWGLLFLGFGLLGTTGRGGEKERPEPVFGGFTLSHDVAVPLLLTVTLAVLVSGVGALYLRHEQRATRLAHHDELRAITNLKVDQIRNWRKERIGDARFFANAEFVRRDVKGLLAATTSEAARQEVSRWMELLRISERYETVRLYDAAWGLVLGVPESPANTRPRSEKEFAAKLPVERALLSDLQPQAGTGQPRLELAAMVSAVPEGPPLAYLVMEVNPDQFLFPLIRRWPMPTRTAEAVLVRAEGEEVVYLNDVRHGTGTALPMRQRLEAASRSPAVRAAAGEEGVTEGIDYRGEPVLAAMISVEDTGWHLIGKIDRREVYARLQEQAWMTLGLVVGLSGLSGLGVGLFTLRRDRRLERQRAALAERLALLMRQANDIVVVLDGGWRIIEANERAVAAYGWAEGELKTRTLRDLFGVEPSDPDTTEGRIWAGEDGRREAVHRRNDGRMFPVEMSQHSSLIGGQVFHQLIIRDITERKAQEARLSRVNRALRTLTETSQVLVRADDEPRLLHDVCRLVVEIGGYRLAWVGYAEQDERRSIRPVARAGDDEGYVDAIRATWDEGELGQGPGGAAIRGGPACFGICDMTLDSSGGGRKH